MEINKTFKITYTKQNCEFVTRQGKCTDKCREYVASTGHKVLCYLDLEATELAGADQYRNATDKITKWSIN